MLLEREMDMQREQWKRKFAPSTVQLVLKECKAVARANDELSRHHPNYNFAQILHVHRLPIVAPLVYLVFS